MKSFNFKVEESKCIHCNRCIEVCSSACLELDSNGYPKMKPEADGVVGWYGCYRCQHCMAVCPQAAISILDRDQNELASFEDLPTPQQLENLMRTRRACRRYKDQEVPREVIDEMLALLENAPTGSNNQLLHFNVVYKKSEMDKFRKLVRDEAFRLAEEGIYPGKFSKEDFKNQTDLEPHRNPGDMFFVNAPHILIIHVPKNRGAWQVDPVIASTWFDLICASRGLGSIIMTLPVSTLANMPEIEAKLQIGDDRFYNIIMGFGYPEYPYARGVKREGIAKITELTF